MPRITPAKPKKLGIDVTNGNFLARLRVSSKRQNSGEGTASFTLNGSVNDSKAKMKFEVGNCNWETFKGKHSKFKLKIVETEGVYKYKLFRKNPGASSFMGIGKGKITSGAKGFADVNQPPTCS